MLIDPRILSLAHAIHKHLLGLPPRPLPGVPVGPGRLPVLGPAPAQPAPAPLGPGAPPAFGPAPAQPVPGQRLFNPVYQPPGVVQAPVAGGGRPGGLIR